MRKFVNLLGLAAALFFVAFGAAAQPIVKAERKKQFAPAAGTKYDAKTGLPNRIVHLATGIVLVLIPAGEFLMGSPADEPDRFDDERQHKRIISQPFYIGETEVTVAQFRKFVQATKYKTDAERGVAESGNKKGAFSATPDGDRQWTPTAGWRNPFPNLKDYRLSENHPVVHISWNDAVSFTKHFSLQLPTEAQWEYAARAQSTTRFFWGDTEIGGQGYGNVQDESGKNRFPKWNSSFPFDDTVVLLSPVKKYKPNNWKAYDLVGNVSEWIQDVYLKDYPGDGTDESAVNGSENSNRVIRGSSWLDAPDYSRSAKRLVFPPQGRRDFLGFRVAVSAQSINFR